MMHGRSLASQSGSVVPNARAAPIRLAILASHPVQYYTPWFRAMAADPRLDIHVFYCHRATAAEQGAAGFSVPFEWDTPLLEGHPHTFLKNVASTPTIRTFWGLNTPEIVSHIAGGNFDAVLVNGWHFYSAWQAIRACWKYAVPVMARSDSHLHTPLSPWKRALKWLPYRWFVPRLDACLAVGTWSRDYFEHYGASPDRVFIVPHVVDERLFGAASEQASSVRSELRARWRLRDDCLTVLFAGKFVPIKQPLGVLQAARTAVARGAQLQLLMVGDGPLRAECEQHAAQNGIPARFVGFLNQSEMPLAYTAADVLVMSSESETWGLVVNEAMHCGRACLVSDQVGCRPDLIVTGQTGDRFPVGDIEALASLFIEYAGNLQKVSDMGNAARKRVKEIGVAAAIEGVHDAAVAVCAAPARRSR
jgi:glycosyltransferase involved in cell wall biosynthesis